jgi:polyisoprenoid-binding protein YceI
VSAAYELGPANGTITIRTGRSGMAARAGHDLVIEVEQWSASLVVPDGSEGESRLDATIDPRSLRVREGRGGLKPLTDADRRDIERTIATKVLHTERDPEITFTASAIRGASGPQWQIDGRLKLAGVTNALQIPVSVERGDGAIRLKATVPIIQSSFGIKPYSGMMGALKVADTVEVDVQASLG